MTIERSLATGTWRDPSVPATERVNDLLAQLPPECRRSLAPDDTGLDLLVGRIVQRIGMHFVSVHLDPKFR